MIHCHKCDAVNSPASERCHACGAVLLPGEGVLDRVGNLIAGLLAAVVAFGLAYFTSKLPADVPECLPTSPTAWLLVAVGIFLTTIISVFRRTPLYKRYSRRAHRHVDLDPEQAVSDFGQALNLAPEKARAELLNERAKLYARLDMESEATRDRLDYTFEEGAFETGAGLARMVGADQDAYKASVAASERAQMIAEGKVKALGYCPKCENVVELTTKLHCPIHTSVKPKDVQHCLPDEVPSTRAKMLEDAEKSTRKSRKWRLGCGIALGVFMLLCVLPAVVVGVINPDWFATPTPTLPESTSFPTATRHVERPTLTPEAFNPFQDGQVACFGMEPFGLTCLGVSGWQSYPAKSLRHWDLDRMTVCSNGQIVSCGYQGISLFDGANWIDQKNEDVVSGSRIACDSSGNIWVIHYQGVSRFDGSDWTTYPSELLGSGEYVDLLKDLAIGPDGVVWVATSDSIARFVGEDWQVFEVGKGFEEEYSFDHIVVDSQGQAWATDGLVLLNFDGTAWEEVAHGISASIMDMVVDGLDRLWLSYYNGVSVLDQEEWTSYTYKNGSLCSEQVESLAIDERGRVWVGTEWGLNVFDGDQWTTYHMHDSGLLENRVEQILVVGEGPDLPPLEEKASGSISGTVTQDGLPWGHMGVEICVETLPFAQYFGDTPCDGQPFLQRATTDSDGKYTLSDLPAGRYYLVFQLDDSTWMEWDESGGRVFVQPGQETIVNIR